MQRASSTVCKARAASAGTGECVRLAPATNTRAPIGRRFPPASSGDLAFDSYSLHFFSTQGSPGRVDFHTSNSELQSFCRWKSFICTTGLFGPRVNGSYHRRKQDRTTHQPASARPGALARCEDFSSRTLVSNLCLKAKHQIYQRRDSPHGSVATRIAVLRIVCWREAATVSRVQEDSP